MQTAIETIEEIGRDIEDIQRKILSLAAPAGEGFTDEQIWARDNAQKNLIWFCGYSLPRLKNAFRKEGG